ncbi:MAG: SDR family NAD(P)-dependent oxidoreductase [Firmicutes bacterium]|nr:SDR family NAD(P)-dependent oxidoreductase [Bacillota bacterium]
MAYKKVAVISGASRGIGLEAAKQLEQAGYIVYHLSRQHGDGLFYHIPCDISNEEEVRLAFTHINDIENRLDLLVCNAGFGISGSIEDTEIKQAEQQFAVNLFGACSCIKYALPALRKNKGRIIAVSSLAGIIPLPFQSYYSASKAALNALILALALEAQPFGVSVTAALPGDAKSSFSAARQKISNVDSVYTKRATHSLNVMEHDEQNGMETIYVAKKIAVLATKKHVRLFYTIGIKYQLFYLLQKLLPLSLTRLIVKKLYA